MVHYYFTHIWRKLFLVTMNVSQIDHHDCRSIVDLRKEPQPMSWSPQLYMQYPHLSIGLWVIYMDYTPLNSKKNNNNNSLNYRKITINTIPLLHHFNPLHIPPVIIHILTINHTLQDTPIYGNMFLSELLVYMQKKHKHRSYWGSPYFFGNSNHPYFHGIFHYKHL